MRHSIFYGTRPIGPPWDEASKNLVYKMSGNLRGFSSIILTYNNEDDLDLPSGVTAKKIYTRNKTRLVSFQQKLSFLVTLFFTQASIYHFYFTPEVYSSRIIRFMKRFKKGKFIQTFATPMKDETLIPQLAFGDAIVAQSDYSLKKLELEQINNTRRIYLGVDTDQIQPGPDTAQLRKQLNITADHVILYAGNYYLGCNDVLAKTIISTCKKFESVQFIMACRLAHPDDAKERTRIQAWLKKENVLDRVIFLESVSNMRELIALSDLHIFPASKMFGKADIPLVLLETLAMEKPIIITDIPPLNELMKDNVGDVIPAGDVDALTKSIYNMISNPSLRIEKGKRGRQMVIREFSFKSYIDQYTELYTQLIQ